MPKRNYKNSPEAALNSKPALAGDLFDATTYNKNREGWDVDMNATAAFWRQDGYIVAVQEYPDRAVLKVWEPLKPKHNLRGLPCFGACDKGSESYFGFGAYAVCEHSRYTVFCTGADDFNWQAQRLASGMRLRSGHEPHPSVEECQQYVLDLYGYEADGQQVGDIPEIPVTNAATA